jgi:hypothetical protein
MPTPPPRATGSAHVHTDAGHCEHCGSAVEVERSYDVKDRFARALLAAVCRSMGLEPFARSKSPTAPIYVRAPDRATHDRMWERFTGLVPALDDRLLEVTRSFIKEQCGLDTPPAPGT